MPISNPLGTIVAGPNAVAALPEVTIRNPQPITAAKAIRRGLVFEYVTGRFRRQMSDLSHFDCWLLGAMKRAMSVPWSQEGLVVHAKLLRAALRCQWHRRPRAPVHRPDGSPD
jgi:hypothetical protein